VNVKIFCGDEELIISLLYVENRNPSFYMRVGKVELLQSMIDGVATVNENGLEVPTGVCVWKTPSHLVVDLPFAFKTMCVGVETDEKLLIPKKMWGYRFRGYLVRKTADDITVTVTFLKDFKENKIKVTREYIVNVKKDEAQLFVYYLSKMDRRTYLEDRKKTRSIYIGPNEREGFYADVKLALEHLLK